MNKNDEVNQSKKKHSYREGTLVALVVLGILVSALYAIWIYTGKDLNSNFFSASSSVITAIATIFYVLLTYFLVKETILLRRENNRPIVTLEIFPSEKWINFLDFEVKNIGKGIAYDIQFEITNQNENPIVKRLEEIAFIKSKINYLAPNRAIKTFLTSLAEDFENKIKPFSIRIRYLDSSKKVYEEIFEIDLSMLKGILSLGGNSNERIAKSLESIEKDIGHLTSGFKKLHVITQTKKENQKENKILDKKWEEKIKIIKNKTEKIKQALKEVKK